jgi:redox-sensitive bicupin YhaK (pirin superfamily)
MTAPRYTGLQRDAIPALATADGLSTVNLIAGAWNGHVGPIASLTGIFMSTLDMRAGAALAFDGLAGRNVFLYVVRGEAEVAGTAVPAFSLAQLDDAGDSVTLRARTDTVVLFGHGAPIGEPVVSHGPFVMNTEQEIVEAIRDYQAGKFGVPLG